MATKKSDSIVATCPKCSQRLRLPRSNEVLTVTCAKCKSKFDLKPSLTPDFARSIQNFISWVKANVNSAPKTALALAAVIAIVCFAFGIYKNRYSPANSQTISQGASPKATKTPQQEHQELINELDVFFNQNRQYLFDTIHPTGTANLIKVHDARIVRTNEGEPLLESRITIYWTGPVQANGHTKLNLLYDVESGRMRTATILSTDGITKNAINNAAWELTKHVITAAVQESIYHFQQ